MLPSQWLPGLLFLAAISFPLHLTAQPAQTNLKFRIKGTLSTEYPGTNYNWAPVPFLYAYSNGQWEVQVGGRVAIPRGTSPPIPPMGSNCRNISGGTRTLRFIQTDDGLQTRSSFATAALFPPAETDLFPIWLACTPCPDIPTGHSAKFGTHGPTGVASLNLNVTGFVETFAITNTGAPRGPGKLEFIRLASTNHAGVSLPLEARLTSFTLLDGTHIPIAKTTVKITSIESDANPFATGFHRPKVTHAVDSRVLERTEGKPVTHFVHDDEWPPIDSPLFNLKTLFSPPIRKNEER